MTLELKILINVFEGFIRTSLFPQKELLFFVFFLFFF
jgi:hypothetical protein